MNIHLIEFVLRYYKHRPILVGYELATMTLLLAEINKDPYLVQFITNFESIKKDRTWFYVKPELEHLLDLNF